MMVSAAFALRSQVPRARNGGRSGGFPVSDDLGCLAERRMKRRRSMSPPYAYDRDRYDARPRYDEYHGTFLRLPSFCLDFVHNVVVLSVLSFFHVSHFENPFRFRLPRPTYRSILPSPWLSSILPTPCAWSCQSLRHGLPGHIPPVYRMV